MPAVVGTGSFWTQMTKWVTTKESDKAACDAIEDTWPKG